MKDEYDMTGGVRGKYFEQMWHGLNPNDITITTYVPAAPGLNDVSMKLAHLPTGQWVEGTGYLRFKLQTELLRLLAQKVAEYNEQKAIRENKSQL